MLCGTIWLVILREIARDFLKESRGDGWSSKESWLWDGEVQAIVKAKRVTDKI